MYVCNNFDCTTLPCVCLYRYLALTIEEEYDSYEMDGMIRRNFQPTY